MAGAAELTAGDDAKRRAHRVHRHRLEHHPPARRPARRARPARGGGTAGVSVPPRGRGLREVMARGMFVPLVDSGGGGVIAPETVAVLASVVAAHVAVARECGA